MYFIAVYSHQVYDVDKDVVKKQETTTNLVKGSPSPNRKCLIMIVYVDILFCSKHCKVESDVQ